MSRFICSGAHSLVSSLAHNKSMHAEPVPESLAQILKDFCHMEWYEVGELRVFVNSQSLTIQQQQLVNEFRQQLSQAIELQSITPEQFKALTAEECSSNFEVAARGC